MKNLWNIIGILAVLVLVAILVRGRQEPPVVVIESPSTSPTLEATPSPTPTPKPVVRRARVSVAPPVPTYAEVARQYEGRRVQFDVFCQVFPVESTFTVGAQVLLDNRSPDDRVVALDSVEHSLKGYGWAVVRMDAPELPAAWAVDCGTAKNVGKIVIEPLATPTPEPLPSPASSSEPLVSPSSDPSPTATVSAEATL